MNEQTQRHHVALGSDHLLIEPERLVIRSPIDMLDWQVREYRRIQIQHAGRRWELVAKVPGVNDTVRYELLPWPEDRREPPGRVVVYDEAYVAARDAEDDRSSRAEKAGLPGFILRPLIGLLPARKKCRLQERGYDDAVVTTRASRSVVYVSLLLSSSGGTVLMVGGGMGGGKAMLRLGLGLLALAVVLLIDLVARFSREREDPQDACGFYEWLWNRNTSVATNSKHGVEGASNVWLPGDPSRERPEPNDPAGGPPRP